MKQLLSLCLVLGLVMPTLLLGGCSSDPTHGVQMGPASMLPMEMQTAPDRVREAYQFASANPAALRNVPCFCGCGGLGHKSNYDCYIKGTAADGTLIWENHAVNCGICVNIAQDVMRMTRAGRAPPAIRDAIIATYSQYGPSNQ